MNQHIQADQTDPALWRLATDPPESSALALVPGRIRLIGLKLATGVKLTAFEQALLAKYRQGDDLASAILRKMAQREVAH